MPSRWGTVRSVLEGMAEVAVLWVAVVAFGTAPLWLGVLADWVQRNGWFSISL